MAQGFEGWFEEGDCLEVVGEFMLLMMMLMMVVDAVAHLG